MKTVDEKFKELGYTKTSESKYGVSYEKEEKKNRFIHEIAILFRDLEDPWIFSTQRDENSDGFRNAVALTVEEMKLCLEKLEEIRENGK